MILKLCGSGTCCPTIERVIKDSKDYFLIKDDFGGKIFLKKEEVNQILATVQKLSKDDKLCF